MTTDRSRPSSGHSRIQVAGAQARPHASCGTPISTFGLLRLAKQCASRNLIVKQALSADYGVFAPNRKESWHYLLPQQCAKNGALPGEGSGK